MSDKETNSKYGHLPGYQLAEFIKNKRDWEPDDEPELGAAEYIEDLPIDDQAALFLQENYVYEQEYQSEDFDPKRKESEPSPFLDVEGTLIGVDFNQVYKILLPIVAGIRSDGAVYKNVATNDNDTLLQIIAAMAVDAGKPAEKLLKKWELDWQKAAEHACRLVAVS